MGKMMMMRSLCRSLYRNSSQNFYSAAVNYRIRHLHISPPSFTPPKSSSFNQNCLRPFASQLGGIRYFSEDVSHMPNIVDPEIERAFKDLMAVNWDELPSAVVYDATKALSKNTDDKAAQDVLKNVFRAAEAVEEFTGSLMSLKMEMDDIVGISGENVQPLPEEHVKAMQTFFDRYVAYLASFGPEETYLKKKVESELGTKMIYLKSRCSGLHSDWGKVSVLGTSGISGSYVEQRA